MALLRDLRHPGGQHAAAGQFPGRSPAGGGAPHRRPASGSTCSPPSPPATWLVRRRWRRSSAWKRRWRRWTSCGACGHFFNWYETQDLHVLEPPYVSSVDSGNLAGHLIALANTCKEWALAPADGIAVGQHAKRMTDDLDLARGPGQAGADRQGQRAAAWRRFGRGEGPAIAGAR